jgi:hypothetical protein
MASRPPRRITGHLGAGKVWPLDVANANATVAASTLRPRPAILWRRERA